MKKALQITVLRAQPSVSERAAARRPGKAERGGAGDADAQLLVVHGSGYGGRTFDVHGRRLDHGGGAPLLGLRCRLWQRTRGEADPRDTEPRRDLGGAVRELERPDRV